MSPARGPYRHKNTTKDKVARVDRPGLSEGLGTAGTDPKGSVHTPGPWSTREYNGQLNGRIASADTTIRRVFIDDQGRRTTQFIAECNTLLPGGVPELAANARLIAAAPEMYDALQMVLAIMCDKKICGHFLPEEIREAIAPAIAKATGR